MAKMTPEKRAELAAKQAAAQEGYAKKQEAQEKKFEQMNAAKILSQTKLNALKQNELASTTSLIQSAQMHAAILDAQVANGESLVANAQELAKLSNSELQSLTMQSKLNDMAHDSSVQALANSEELDLLADEGFKRLEKQAILDEAAHKTTKGMLDLEKELGLLHDKSLQQANIAQTIQASKLTTSTAIAQIAIDAAVAQDADLSAQKESLRVLEKQISRRSELNETLDKFKTFKDDVFEVIQDPAVAGGLFLVAWGNELNKLNNTLVEMEGNMELSRSQAIELGPTMASANIQGALMGVSSKKTAAAMEGMAEAMGTVGNLTGKQIAQTAKLSKELGVGAKETGKMVGHMMLVGNHTVESAKASLKMTASLARGAGVPIGKVMGDVAANMEMTSKFGNISVKELGAMAVEAAKMGTTLSNISALGDKMMDVDNARNDAMELSVLLGKQVNIDKVQQLIYEGKGAEANKEMLKQLGGISAFNDMDYFQKKRAADMMGVTTGELEKQLNKAAGLTETGTAQASGWAKVTEKAGDYFGVLKENSGTVLASMNMFKSLGSSMGSFGAGAKGATSTLGKLKGGLGGLKDKFLGKKPGADIKSPLKSDITADIDKTAKSSDQVSKGPKKGMKDKLKDLAAGLKKMGGKGVIQGIGNMALAGPALLMAVPAIPFLLFMGKVKLSAIEENFKGLGKGLSKMGKSLKGAAVMALAGPALALATLAIPFLAFMGLAPLAMLATNFQFLATGLKSLGKGFTSILKGLLVLALLGVAMIPAMFAFSLLKGVDPMSILAFSLGLGILGLAAAGLGMIFPMVMLGSLALAILGVAIIPAALAMQNLKGVDGGAIISFALGLGLIAIAVAAMGLLAIPIALGAIAAKLLGPAIEPAVEALSKIKGVDPASIIGFAMGLGLIAVAIAGMGIMIIGIGLGAIAAKLLGPAIEPVIEALAGIKGVDGGAILSFAMGLGLMAIAVAGMGMMAIPIAFGAVAAHLLAAAIEPAVAALSGLVGADPGAVSSFASGLLGIATTVAAIGLMAPLLMLGGIAIAMIAIPLLAFNKAMAIMPENFDLTGFAEGMKTLGTAGVDLIPAALGIGIMALALSGLAIALLFVTPMMLLFTGALIIIGEQLPAIVDGIVRVLESVKEVIIVISTEIIKVITAIQTAVIDIVTQIANQIVTVVTTIGDVISTTIKSIADDIIRVITAITTGIQLVGNVIDSIINNIATSIINVVTTVGAVISSTVSAIANEIIKVINAISAGIQAIGTVIVNVITGIASGIAMVVESIAGGISQIVTGIGNAISGIIDSFTGFIATLGSISPSQIFSLAAGFTVLGIAGLAMGVGSIGIIGMSGALGLLALSLGLLQPLMPVIDKLAQFGLLGDVGIESNVSTTSTEETPEEEKPFDNAILATKLDTLIELMTKGGTVTLDGKKVGQILNNAMGPIGA